MVQFRGTVKLSSSGVFLVVPSRFRALFWDADVETLDVEKHKTYIVERILEFGDEDAYRWMFGTYADEEIIAVVRKSRRISPRTAAMMGNFYRIPREELRCLELASDQVH